jgi:tetratricopeptide (TPR) repeat protein
LIREYKEAIRLAPEYANAYFSLGLAYKRKRLKNEAIREFERVLEIKPDHEKARKALQGLLLETNYSGQ